MALSGWASSSQSAASMRAVPSPRHISQVGHQQRRGQRETERLCQGGSPVSSQKLRSNDRKNAPAVERYDRQQVEQRQQQRYARGERQHLVACPSGEIGSGKRIGKPGRRPGEGRHGLSERRVKSAVFDAQPPHVRRDTTDALPVEPQGDDMAKFMDDHRGKDRGKLGKACRAIEQRAEHDRPRTDGKTPFVHGSLPASSCAYSRNTAISFSPSSLSLNPLPSAVTAAL